MTELHDLISRCLKNKIEASKAREAARKGDLTALRNIVDIASIKRGRDAEVRELRRIVS